MMSDYYRENILDHYQNPRHRGEVSSPTIREHDANPLCGDDLTVDMVIDKNKVVRECKFHGHGCAISQAAADILCAEVSGRPLCEVVGMSKEEMLELLGIPLGPVRLKCGLLAYKIMKMAAIKHESQVVKNES